MHAIQNIITSTLSFMFLHFLKNENLKFSSLLNFLLFVGWVAGGRLLDGWLAGSWLFYISNICSNIDRCLKNSPFPLMMKLGNITSVYKKYWKLVKGNCRTANVWPNISKFYGSVLFKKMSESDLKICVWRSNKAKQKSKKKFSNLRRTYYKKALKRVKEVRFGEF